MFALIALLFVISTVVAVVGWMRALKLDQKLTSMKRRIAELDSQRTYLVAQTTQMAEENAQLKVRLASMGPLDMKTLQKTRSDAASMMGTKRNGDQGTR